MTVKQQHQSDYTQQQQSQQFTKHHHQQQPVYHNQQSLYIPSPQSVSPHSSLRSLQYQHSPHTSVNSVASTIYTSPDISPANTVYQRVLNHNHHIAHHTSASPQSSHGSDTTASSSNASPMPLSPVNHSNDDVREKLQQRQAALLQMATVKRPVQTTTTTQSPPPNAAAAQSQHKPVEQSTAQPTPPPSQQAPQPIYVTDRHGQQHDLAVMVASNDTQTFAGLAHTGRYKIIDNLQLSLFGSVKLAYDYHTNEEVAIKISARNLATDGRARSGVKVLENVKREANVMRYLANYRILHSIGDEGLIHCSCTAGCVCTHAAKLQQWQHNNPLDQSTDFICGIVDEIEDDMFHYLVTEYVSGGDMHSLLLSMPQHRLSEHQAKYLFRQLCLGIQFLHEHSIAHLDLSLENVCLSAAGRIKVIDFGVAVIHPLAPKPPKRAVTQALLKRSQQQSLIEVGAPTLYNADSPTSSPNNTPIASRTRTLSSRARVAHSVVVDTNPQGELMSHQNFSPVNDMCSIHGKGQSILNTFVCSNISDPRMQPGKVGYMSNELFGGVDLWDAYSNDTFSLGVILYCMLTGRPPFVHPSLNDPWYKAIASGQWLHMLHAQQRQSGGIQPHTTSSQPDSQSFVQVFAHLSPDALDLLDKILKPQKYRMTLRAVLAHPWLQDSNKRQRTFTQVAPVDVDVVMNNQSPMGSPGKTHDDVIIS